VRNTRTHSVAHGASLFKRARYGAHTATSNRGVPRRVSSDERLPSAASLRLCYNQGTPGSARPTVRWPLLLVRESP
jgi:hypothetical protein